MNQCRFIGRHERQNPGQACPVETVVVAANSRLVRADAMRHAAKRMRELEKKGRDVSLHIDVEPEGETPEVLIVGVARDEIDDEARRDEQKHERDHRPDQRNPPHHEHLIARHATSGDLIGPRELRHRLGDLRRVKP
jgi:hypothetical protein